MRCRIPVQSVSFQVTKAELQAELARREEQPWDRETYEMALEALESALKAAPTPTPEWRVAMIRCFAATFASIAIQRRIA